MFLLLQEIPEHLNVFRLMGDRRYVPGVVESVYLHLGDILVNSVERLVFHGYPPQTLYIP